MEKHQQYLEVSRLIVDYVGGIENIKSATHCVSRLRLVLRNRHLAELYKLDSIELVKASIFAGDQLQLVIGVGVVNELYEVFTEYTGKGGTRPEPEITEKPSGKQSLHRILKSISDAFIEILPAILGGALLIGCSGLLENIEFVRLNETLHALCQLAQVIGNGIFRMLPMLVCYSAVKQFGGNPLFGLVVGAIMLNASASNLSGGETAVEVVQVLGMDVWLGGFRSGVLDALLMGYIVALLDIFLHRKIPLMVRGLLAPLLTIFLSCVLLFMIIGPVGQVISREVTNDLLWMAGNLGAFGYAVFAGVQQIIVITGLHHIITAVEAQLLVDTGTNFLQPLMSVALMGQGGALLGYLILNWKSQKAHSLCIPSFVSILVGVSEPALFGVNLRYRYPLMCGCFGGAAAGIYVYMSGLTAIGMGTSSLPGISLASPMNNGYSKYLIAHLISLSVAFVSTVIYGKLVQERARAVNAAGEAAKNECAVNAGMEVSGKTASSAMERETAENNGTVRNAGVETVSGTIDWIVASFGPGGAAAAWAEVIEQIAHTSDEVHAGVLEFTAPTRGAVKSISESADATFASKILGDGIFVENSDGKVWAPCNAQVLFVFEGGHAVGLLLEDKTGVLLHCGIGTVELEGEGFCVYVQKGQYLKQGDPILSFDRELLEQRGYSSEVIMLFTEFGENRRLELCYTGMTDGTDVIGCVREK